MDLLNLMRSSFPKTIDKSKSVFCSLIANENNDAALQKQILDLFNYMKEWTLTPDVYEQKGDMLMKSVTFFSFLERFADETELSLKNRFRAIFVRNHDQKWGTPFDVKNVFRQYFAHADIYLVENTNKIDAVETGMGNLLENGDINSAAATGWTLQSCSATPDARFSKGYGIELAQSGAKASQEVSVSGDKVYYLHFFLKGKVSVQIKDNHDKYWDFSTNTWESSPIDNEFNSADWNNISLFFITNNNASEVTLSFIYVDTDTYIDYFRLFAKQPYSSFTVIAHYDGEKAVNAFGLASGEADPNIPTTSPTPPQPRYGNYGYYDDAYLSGVAAGFASDIYDDLLNYVRAQGIKAYFDIVLRDFE